MGPTFLAFDSAGVKRQHADARDVQTVGILEHMELRAHEEQRSPDGGLQESVRPGPQIGAPHQQQRPVSDNLRAYSVR